MFIWKKRVLPKNANIRLNADAVTYTDPAANEAVAKSKELQTTDHHRRSIAKEKAKPEEFQHKEQIVQK